MYRSLIVVLLFPIFSALTANAQSAQAPGAADSSKTNTRGDVQPSPATAPSSPNGPAAEVWTALPLAESGLPVSTFNAVPLGKYQQPEFTRDLVRVQWRSGDPIDLYVIRPSGSSKPPVILYLYDYRFDTDRFRDDGWCRQAIQGGFAAVGFASALSPQRFHAPRPMKEWFVSELEESLGTSTHDVQMILNYLDARGDMDVRSVGFYGQGSGGAIAILAAEADRRIAVLDLLNPWGDWPDWIRDSQQIPEDERAPLLKPEFLAGVSGLDPILYIPGLKLKALRIQQVMDDLVTPASARDKIAAAIQGHGELIRYKDSAAHRDAWRTYGLSGWMREKLRP
jgi:hypothetical protein